jgi:predicted outer membrane repeat protein
MVTGSTVSHNTATNGGGIYNGDTLTLKNSTISENTASQDGGGIYNEGAATAFGSTVLTLTGSTVSGNTAGRAGGGGIFFGGTISMVTLNSSTVSGNSPDECAPQRLAKKVC